MLVVFLRFLWLIVWSEMFFAVAFIMQLCLLNFTRSVSAEAVPSVFFWGGGADACGRVSYLLMP